MKNENFTFSAGGPGGPVDPGFPANPGDPWKNKNFRFTNLQTY